MTESPTPRPTAPLTIREAADALYANGGVLEKDCAMWLHGQASKCGEVA